VAGQDYLPDDWGGPTVDSYLGDIRYLVRRWQKRPTGLTSVEVAQLVDAIDQLDDHMAMGGEQPRAWREGVRNARYRPVENTPPL
jgi:hypothetical protein